MLIWSKWLLAVFVTKGFAQDFDIGNYFSLLARANAECDDEQISQLNQYMADCDTLLNSYVAAELAALVADDGGVAGRNGLVARRLFTAWFGIKFTDAVGEVPTQTDETEPIWDAMHDAVQAVIDVVSTGSFVGPGLMENNPWLSCSGEFAQKYSWADQAYSSDGYLVPGNSIGDLYGDLDTKNPYWIDEVTTYVWEDSKMLDNICDTYDNGEGREIATNAQSILGDTEGVRTTTNGQLIYFEDKTPGLLMCPRAFESDLDILDDIEWQDPNGRPLFNTIYPLGSATTFHELFHLATSWEQPVDEDGNPVENEYGDLVIERNKNTVEDITYNPLGCLELAEGTMPSHNPIDSTKNAETYVLFALSYWYYQQTWGTNTPATFFSGFLQPWTELT